MQIKQIINVVVRFVYTGAEWVLIFVCWCNLLKNIQKNQCFIIGTTVAQEIAKADRFEGLKPVPVVERCEVLVAG